MSILDLVAWYLDRLNCKRPESVAQQVAHVVRILGDREATELRGVDIAEYRSTRRGEGVSDSTANRELTYLRAAFRKAMRLELEGVDRMPHFEMVREPEGRTGWLSLEQVDRVASYLDRYGAIGDFVRFAAATGWRKAAIAGLEWTDIDVGRGVIEMPARLAKSRRSVRFPLEGAVLPIIERRLAEAKYGGEGQRLVFHRDGAPVRTFAKSWSSALAAAGASPHRVFHDLRRTFVLTMREGGVAESVIMRLCDMSRQTLDRYSQVRVDDLKRAVRAVSRRSLSDSNDERRIPR